MTSLGFLVNVSTLLSHFGETIAVWAHEKHLSIIQRIQQWYFYQNGRYWHKCCGGFDGQHCTSKLNGDIFSLPLCAHINTVHGLFSCLAMQYIVKRLFNESEKLNENHLNVHSQGYVNHRRNYTDQKPTPNQKIRLWHDWKLNENLPLLNWKALVWPYYTPLTMQTNTGFYHPSLVTFFHQVLNLSLSTHLVYIRQALSNTGKIFEVR